MAIRQPPTSFKDPNQRQFLQELRNAIKSVTEQVEKIKPRVINITNDTGSGGGGGGDGLTQAAVILTVNPAAPVPGGEFTLTATVTGNSPTGSLAFSKDGTAISTVPLSNGVATLTQTLTAGSYAFTASYSGDVRNRSASASLTVTVATGGSGGGGDGQDPPAPLNLQTHAEPWAIRLTWDQPTLPPDYLMTQVWARNSTSGAKILIGEIAGTQYTFTGPDDAPLTVDDVWYFWVRNADTEGRFSAYEPDDDVGVSGECLPSPDTLIDDLVTDITSSTFYNYLAQKIQLLQGPVGIPDSVNKRLDDQKTELVQRISEITVSSNGTIDTAEIWHFDGGTQGWTVSGTGATVQMVNGVLVVAAGSATATVLSPTISVSGPAYHAVRVRMKQVKADPGDDDWDSTLAYKKSGSGTLYTYTPVTPSSDLSGFTDFDWELADETSPVWTAANTVITQVGFQLAAGQTLHFDWVAVGRVAPGASYAQVEAVRVNSNRTIYTPNSGSPNYAGPTEATLGYPLRINDIWFDTAPAVFDASGNLLRGGNKPHYWNSSQWVPVTDERLRVSYSEIWNIANAVAGPTGSAANRISGIATTSSSALTTAQSKASLSQVESAFAGDSGSLSSRLNNIEASIGGENNVSASIREFQKAAVGYATLNSTGAVFEGNGTFIVYPVATFPDATYPQYAATNRKTIIDSVGVTRWNAGNPGNLATWNTGLPLATAIKQVSITAANGQTATVQQQFEAIYGATGLRSQWAVKIDSAGFVSGFGLSTTSNNDSSYSEFAVRANRFYIAAPTDTVKKAPQALVTLDSSQKVIHVYTTLVNGSTVYWAMFRIANALNINQFQADAWVTFSGMVQSAWNGSFLIDHIGKQPTDPAINGANANDTIYLKFENSADWIGFNGNQLTSGSSGLGRAASTNIPFIVLPTSRTINGVSVPSGVYATNAYIRKAQITEAHIRDAAITNAKIGNVIQSTNFVSGPNGTGWKIDKNGDIEAGSLTVRTKNIEANAVSRIYSGSSGGYIAYNPSVFANLAIPLNGERGDIIIIMDISIQSAPGTSCQVWFEGYINNARLDYKNITTPRGFQFTVGGQTVTIPPPGGYGNATLMLKDSSKASTMTAKLIPTVIDGTPSSWSWSYIVYELKR